LGKKRTDDEYRQRQAAIEDNVQKRKVALFEEQLRKGKTSFAGTGRCRRRGDIFKFQRNYIDSARVSVNEKYSMINRARALGKTGKVLPEVEAAYFSRPVKKKSG
jgi:hypothetical protein